MASTNSINDIDAFLEAWKLEINAASSKQATIPQPQPPPRRHGPARPPPSPLLIQKPAPPPTITAPPPPSSLLTRDGRTFTRIGSEVSPAHFHGPTPTTFNFACLPPEVRINIYNEVINDNANDKGILQLPDMKSYAGLALSCKDVNAELEYEWIKEYNAADVTAVDTWQHPMTALRVVRGRRFEAPEHLHIYYSGQLTPDIWSGLFLNKRILKKLSGQFSTITFHPDPSFPPIDDNTTIAALMASDQLDWMVKLYYMLKKSPASPSIVAGFDFFRQEAYCVRCAPVTASASAGRHLYLPPENLEDIYEPILSDCMTVGDLKAYRGFIMFDSDTRENFFRCLLRKFGVGRPWI